MSQTPNWQVLPPLFLERLPELIPNEAQRTAVLNSFCHKKSTTFRANTLKITPDELALHLTKAGFELERVPWFEAAFILKNRSLRELSEDTAYVEGWLYVQSLSSMIPPLVLQPQPGERVLDLTAAPGSKTTQMAAMMKNEGSILANDTSLVRLFKLQANLDTQGVTNTKTQRSPGQDLWQAFPETFDRTLVDVPCSMEGRFLCEVPKTYENWSPKKNKELVVRQRTLLRSAVSATKPGGNIVYSTCTLSVDENEGVVEWLLKKEGSALELQSIEVAGLEKYPSLTTWKHKVFHPEMSKTLRILPSQTQEGFFVAHFKKLRSTVVPIL